MPKRILITEDDPYLAKLYSKHLSAEPGFAVEIVRSGEEAIAAIGKNPPDLLLLDLLLPGTDGFGVLEYVKSNPERFSFPVIILTNLGQEADIERGRKLGASDYLVKSDLYLTELAEKVRQYL